MAYPYATLETEIRQRFGWNDGNRDALIVQWANRVAQEIWEAYDWSEFYKIARVWTIAEYSTGTVSIANGSTAVTGSGTAFTSNMVGAFIKFDDNEYKYTISAVGSGTTLTLEEAFQGTSIVAGTYTISQGRYALPSDFARLSRVSVEDRWLSASEAMTQDQWLVLTDGDISSGDPFYYGSFNHAGYTRLHLWPIPSEKLGVSILYKRLLTDCTGSGTPDLVDLPNDTLIRVCRQGVIAYGALFEYDKEQHQREYAMFRDQLDRAIRDSQKDRKLPERRAYGDYYTPSYKEKPQTDWFV